jgi:flavin-dependent dehydrogenase
VSNELVCDVAVIGAGPAGAVASALLVQKGHRVVVLEREHFPRFSIGESLLPQSMEFLEEAGMIDAVQQAGFQIKDGAAFEAGGRFFAFEFADKVSPGWSTTYQVKRAQFDKVLADEAARFGAKIYYGQTITAFDETPDGVALSYAGAAGGGRLKTQFCLDGSGFGRVLPRLLDLDRPSEWPVRQALFTHVTDHIDPAGFDRNKILITVHPIHRDVWFWLIPFSDGTCSLGVVGEVGVVQGAPGIDDAAKLRHWVFSVPNLGRLLARAEWNVPVRQLAGYAAKVSSLHGKRFALLGNAGEFLDPIFSSGVTIALKSSSLAARCLDRQLHGEEVDWQAEFAEPLTKGIDTFRHFVRAWYDGQLQDIIFSADKAEPRVRQMVCAILAGYAWDADNPLVARTAPRLAALAELVRAA